MAKPNSLPSVLHILGVPFRVELVDGIDDGDTMGDTTGTLHRIRIDANLDRAKQWRVLWHESIHGCLHVIGASSVLDEKVEEMVTQSLEYGLEQVLRQIGPQLIRSFAADEELT